MTADEGAIQDILKQIEAAWNSYDSVSLAALFAEDANISGTRRDAGERTHR
jgi:hypothetical protein